ncbi:MAG: hypothetical protein QNK23_09485 [Crocinitomicaceae bacterium]|nr:hypothetical protein [Crocinitomicaceae bacterium]
MKKKIVIGVVAFLGLFFLFLVWFEYTYSMDKIDGLDQGDKASSVQVLIASQGSEYKIDVVDGILSEFAADEVYFKVIDVTSLDSIDPEEWNAIVLLHTWEIWEPEENSEAFINAHYNPEKMFVVTTSGSGNNQIEGVDGITGPSEMNQIDVHVKEITDWINKVIMK